MNTEKEFWHVRARHIMRNKGILIKDVAECVSLTPSAVGHYLSGRRQPDPGMLRKIAEVLGVSVSEMIEDDPLFARNQLEHDALESLRMIPDHKKDSAIAMLRALIEVPEPLPPPE